MTVEKTKSGGTWWQRVFGANEDARPPEVKPAATPEATPAAPVDVRDDAPLGQVPDSSRGQAPAPETTQKPWQSRLDVSTKEDSLVVARATLAVLAGVPVEILLEPVKSAAASMIAGVDVKDQNAIVRVYDRMLATLHPEAVAQALQSVAFAANEAIHASVEMVGHKDEVPLDKGDKRDWHRTWGLRLVPDDDACFRDPAYLVNFNLESRGIRATSFEGRTSVTGARELFEDEWKELAPNTKLLCFTESGSDSVSLCFQIATACGRRRLKNPNANPGMAFFNGCYGGGRGLAASMNWAGWGKDSAERKNEWRVPSPTSYTMTPSGAELERVKALEREALLVLEEMANKSTPPLGAIFLEPLQGSNGVQFYRREFLVELRAFADRKGLPIIADEVLTGGGRTGKFFAYELYDGFKPDFVVFGKGLQTSGIAEVKRDGRVSSQVLGQWDLGVTTAGGDATRFLKGAQVMKRVREGRLMENAAATGKYLVEKLREVQKFHGATPDASGAGFIVGMSHLAGAEAEVSTVVMLQRRDRYLPPLTLTKAEIDEVITALKKPLPDVNLLKARRSVAELRAELADETDPERRALIKRDIARFDEWIAARERAAGA